jgi:hypothetical protein
MLNAINFLFEREEISPVIIRNIMLYCLDCSNTEGILGKSGTSRAAMMFLSNWLNGFGSVGQLTVSSEYFSGKQVSVGAGSRINNALNRGGVVVVRVSFECDHYVLLTGRSEGNIYMFDPYFVDEPFPEKDILFVEDEPYRYNRIVPEKYFNRENQEIYALGPVDEREAVVLYNERTRKPEEQTIEYYI